MNNASQRLPATPSIQRATQHYESIVAGLNPERLYSMQELNKEIARYCLEHDLGELEYDNIMEVKWERMLAATRGASEAKHIQQGCVHVGKHAWQHQHGRKRRELAMSCICR